MARNRNKKAKNLVLYRDYRVTLFSYSRSQKIGGQKYGKKNEVVRCVRQQTIATYEVGDDFLVDVVLDVKELMYSYWLYHKEYGVKVRYVQVPKIYMNDDGDTIINIAKPEDVENYFNPEAWKENKKHYTDNYILV